MSDPRKNAVTPANRDQRLALDRASLGQISTIAASCLAVWAAYKLFEPNFYSTSSGNLRCGSALRPAATEFARNVCGGLAQSKMTEAVFLGLMAAVVAFLGRSFFGGNNRAADDLIDPSEDIVVD